MLVPTTNGLVIYDGRSAQVVATLGAGTVGLQNTPMVTIDPNGTIGITIAGYNAQNAGIIQHYEIGGLERALAGQAVVADVPPEPAADRMAEPAAPPAT